jgi:hypothetical protein
LCRPICPKSPAVRTRNPATARRTGCAFAPAPAW